MKTWKFHGHSDDVFCWADDESDDCAQLTTRVVKVSADGQSLFVFGRYTFGEKGPDVGGVWGVGLALPEDQPMPPWPMRWSQHKRGYSVCLELDVPDHATVEIVRPDED